MADVQNPYGFDFAGEQEKIAQRKRMADMMFQMSFQPQQGQMVSGRFVAPSPLAALLPLAAGFRSQQEQEGIQGDLKDLTGKYNQALTKGLDRYFTTRQGLPGTGPSLEEPPTPGTPGDPRRAAIQALTSGLPALARVGQSDLEALSKGQITPKDLLTVPGMDPTSRVTAALAGDPSRLLGESKEHVINGQLFVRGAGEPGFKPTVDARDRFADPFEYNGNLLQNNRNTGEIKTVARPPSTTTNILNSGENAGMKAWAELSAKTVKDLNDSARASARTLTALNNVTANANSGVLNGPLSNFGIFLGQLGTAAGLRVDAAKLANSETFNSEVTRLWAEMMQANGGARGLVKEESERMMQSLPQLSQTPEGRKQIINILRQAAQQNIETAQQASREFAEALRAGDPTRFTFGLGQTMYPSPAVDEQPAQPGSASQPGLRAPVIRNW